MAEVRQQDYRKDVITRQGDGEMATFLDDGRKSTTADRVAEIRAEHPDLPAENIYDLNSVVESGQWRDSNTEQSFNFIPDEGYRYDRIGMAYDVNTKTYQYDNALPRMVRSGIAQGFGHLRDMASEPIASAMAGLYGDGEEGARSDIEKVWTPDYLLEAKTNPADTWAAYGEEMGASLVGFGVDWIGGKSVLRSKGQTAPKKVIDAIDPVRWKKFMSGFATRLEQETAPSLIFAEFINAQDPLNDVNAAPMVGAWLESMGMTGQTVEYLKGAQDDQFSKGVTNVILGTMMMELMRGAGVSGFKVGKFAYDNAAEFVQKAYKNAVDEMDAIQKALPASMVAFHGTGAKFDKFSTEFMGSGEGAQAYGYGAYFAESKGIGKGYQKAMAGNDITIDGRTIPVERQSGLGKLADMFGDDPVGVAKGIESGTIPLDSIPERHRKDAKKWAGIISNADNVEYNTGNLYEVDIPDEQIAKMLDWDAPISEQSYEVQTYISNLDIGDIQAKGAQRKFDEMELSATNDSGLYDYWEEGGLKEIAERVAKGEGTDEEIDLINEAFAGYANVYDESIYLTGLERQFGVSVGDALDVAGAGKGGDVAKKISSDLNDMGIPGIKYLDGGSRSASEGTRNFVVFKPDDLKILKRNNEKVK